MLRVTDERLDQHGPSNAAPPGEISWPRRPVTRVVINCLYDHRVIKIFTRSDQLVSTGKSNRWRTPQPRVWGALFQDGLVEQLVAWQSQQTDDEVACRQQRHVVGGREELRNSLPESFGGPVG